MTNTYLDAICSFCASNENTFHQYLGVYYCASCGRWQKGENVKTLTVRGSTKVTTGYMKKIYLTYDNVNYVVNLFYDDDRGYELYWLDENYTHMKEPKWVEEFEKILTDSYFEFWLDERTEN